MCGRFIKNKGRYLPANNKYREVNNYNLKCMWSNYELIPKNAKVLLIIVDNNIEKGNFFKSMARMPKTKLKEE